MPLLFAFFSDRQSTTVLLLQYQPVGDHGDKLAIGGKPIFRIHCSAMILTHVGS